MKQKKIISIQTAIRWLWLGSRTITMAWLFCWGLWIVQVDAGEGGDGGGRECVG